MAEYIIIIFVAVSFILYMRYLDTMPGYYCPPYCAIDHEHYPLDSQSDFRYKGDKNTK